MTVAIEERCWIVWLHFLWLKIWINFSMLRIFSSKVGPISCFFGPLWLSLPKVETRGDLKTSDKFSWISERELIETWRPIYFFWIKIFRFLQIQVDNYTKCIISFFNIRSCPLNSWYNSQAIAALELLVGHAAKSGIGLILSWILKIRNFLNFFWCCFFQKILLVFYVNYWYFFYSQHP